MSPVVESLFTLLFKYKPFVFEKGRLLLSPSWPAVLVAVVLIVAAVPAIRRYAEVGGKTSNRDRKLLAALRVAVVVLLVLCLLRPSLLVATAVPQQNFIGVLIDDSRSMRIADLAGQPRSAQLHEWLDDESPLLSALRERFKLRLFSFAAGPARVEGVSELSFSGHRTNLARALDRARQELASVPLSGLVLITDGADNAETGLTEAINSLRDATIPVFAVGVGSEEFSRDIEVVRVEVPGEVLKGSSVGADVVVRQRGFDDETVQLFVEDDGRILSTVDVPLPRAGESTVVRTRFLAEEAGPRLLTFRIAAAEGETVQRNNELQALVTVSDEQARILYFEGEPRHEVAFIRRALHEDQNIALAVLVRSAENKFQSLIVDPDERFGGEQELYGGFPRTREQLYRYSGVILGSVEASFFTADQLRMLSDFVSQRGGGLLTLGGRYSFANGGYAGTPVADVLPVVLPTASDLAQFAEVDITPTLFGRSHPAVQLADTLEESQQRWDTLPPLLTVNPIWQTKLGAATLLEGSSESLSDPQVVLAYQRYGAGKSIALTVTDTWQWQMHQDIPLEDQTHEMLWQQLLRWVVSDVPGQVRADLGLDRFAVGETVQLSADVFDDTYLAVNNARVVATITDPTGAVRELPLQWDVEVDGRYRGAFAATQEGYHRVDVEALRNGELLGQDSITGEAAELTREFFGAEMNRSLLERVADETGGQFYTAATVDELPGDIAFADGGTTVTELLDLWDMPIFFLLFVALIGVEWSLRKLRRLA